MKTSKFLSLLLGLALVLPLTIRADPGSKGSGRQRL